MRRIAAFAVVMGQCEGGAAIYEVEIAGNDGKLHEVAVSASDNKVLGQEIEVDEGSEEDNDSDNQGTEDAG